MRASGAEVRAAAGRPRYRGDHRSTGQPCSHEEAPEADVSLVTLFFPLPLGVRTFERAFDRISKTATDGYPPYNVEQRDENRLRITIAVAGFAPAELSIEVEGNQLMVRGKQSDQSERVFLHRGIAARQFQRSFVLAEGIEVEGAALDNGLLHIDLERPLNEPAVKTIAIKNVAKGTGSQTIEASASGGRSQAPRAAAKTAGDEGDAA